MGAEKQVYWFFQIPGLLNRGLSIERVEGDCQSFPVLHLNKAKTEGKHVRLTSYVDVLGPKPDMSTDEAWKFSCNYLLKQQLKVDLHLKACKAFLSRVASEEAKDTDAKRTRMGAAARWRFAVSNMASGVLMRPMGVAATGGATFKFSDFPPTFSSTAARKRKPSAKAEDKAKADVAKRPKLPLKKEQEASKDRGTISEEGANSGDSGDSGDRTKSFNNDELVEESPLPPPPKRGTKRQQRRQDFRKEVENADGEIDQKALLLALTRQAAQNMQEHSRYGSSLAMQEEVKRLQEASANLNSQLQELAQRHAEEKANLAAQHEAALQREKAEAKAREQQHLDRESKMRADMVDTTRMLTGVQEKLVEDNSVQADASRKLIMDITDKSQSTVLELQKAHQASMTASITEIKALVDAQDKSYQEARAAELLFQRQQCTQLIAVRCTFTTLC